jgi:hypothetical protein
MWLRRKMKRQGVIHVIHMQAPKNERREDFPFCNVADGEQQRVGSKPNCNIGGNPRYLILFSRWRGSKLATEDSGMLTLALSKEIFVLHPSSNSECKILKLGAQSTASAAAWNSNCWIRMSLSRNSFSTIELSPFCGACGPHEWLSRVKLDLEGGLDKQKSTCKPCPCDFWGIGWVPLDSWQIARTDQDFPGRQESLDRAAFRFHRD